MGVQRQHDLPWMSGRRSSLHLHSGKNRCQLPHNLPVHGKVKSALHILEKTENKSQITHPGPIRTETAETVCRDSAGAVGGSLRVTAYWLDRAHVIGKSGRRKSTCWQRFYDPAMGQGHGGDIVVLLLNNNSMPIVTTRSDIAVNGKARI